MKGMPSEEVISFSWPATSICSCSDSTTQGPEMRKKGWSSPTSKPQSFIAVRRRSCDRFQRFAARALLGASLVLAGGVDEGVEERVAVPGRRLELGVELHAHEPGVHVL